MSNKHGRGGMSGKHYGSLKALTCVGHFRNHGYMQQLWECRCDCGRIVEKTDRELKHRAFKDPLHLNCGADIHKQVVKNNAKTN